MVLSVVSGLMSMTASTANRGEAVPDPFEATAPGPTLPEQARPDAAPADAPRHPDGGRRRMFLHLLGNTLVASVVNFTVWSPSPSGSTWRPARCSPPV